MTSLLRSPWEWRVCFISEQKLSSESFSERADNIRVMGTERLKKTTDDRTVGYMEWSGCMSWQKTGAEGDLVLVSLGCFTKHFGSWANHLNSIILPYSWPAAGWTEWASLSFRPLLSVFIESCHEWMICNMNYDGSMSWIMALPPSGHASTHSIPNDWKGLESYAKRLDKDDDVIKRKVPIAFYYFVVHSTTASPPSTHPRPVTQWFATDYWLWQDFYFSSPSRINGWAGVNDVVMHLDKTVLHIRH